MPKNSLPTRGVVTRTGQVLLTGGALPVGSMTAGYLTGHPVAGLLLAAMVMLGPLALRAIPTVSASLIALLNPDTQDATKRIGALTDLVDKLR